MLRYYYLIVVNLFGFAKMIHKMKKLTADPNATESEKYEYLQYMVSVMQKKGFTRTEVYGTDNLPKEGGYVMYPNHQGKYDAFGILWAHENPCTVVMDKAKSYDIFIKQVIDMIEGKRLDKEDVRQAFTIISEMTEEVKQGRRYVVFPEGEYDKDKKNTLWDFKAGCFKVSLKSKTPMVPVVLVDSYKAWNSSKLGTVTTQVHFLEPIFYDEYKDKKTKELADMVRERIQQKLTEIVGK